MDLHTDEKDEEGKANFPLLLFFVHVGGILNKTGNNFRVLLAFVSPSPKRRRRGEDDDEAAIGRMEKFRERFMALWKASRTRVHSIKALLGAFRHS